jgi:hypothetical protein
VEVGEVDEVYEDNELPSSFNIDPKSALGSLPGDANDVTVPKETEHQISKKNKCRIFNILVFDIMFFIFHINFLLFHMMFLIFHIMFSLQARGDPEAHRPDSCGSNDLLSKI